MNIQHLVKMANQIGQFFEDEPDQGQAIKDVALHLKRFWDLKMRQAIVSHVNNGGEGLLPIVMEAVTDYQELLA